MWSLEAVTIMGAQLHLWGDEEPGDRLRWSISRDKRMQHCLRKYYLFHYASRGALQPGASALARQLFVLRSLRNRYMWVGEVVHHMIELAMGAFSRGEEVSVEDLIERGTQTMRAHYVESMQGVYWDRPIKAVGLMEHEYQEPISREEWRAQRDSMEQCLRHFFALPLTERIRALPRWRWLALESGGTFEINGAQVMVRPDFAWREEDDRVVMVDWKTGLPRPEDEQLQLAVYGLFARRTWGLGADHMQAVIAYLRTGEVRVWEINTTDLEAAEQRIQQSLARMRALAAAGDAGDLEAFPLAKPDKCGLCGFRRVCQR